MAILNYSHPNKNNEPELSIEGAKLVISNANFSTQEEIKIEIGSDPRKLRGNTVSSFTVNIKSGEKAMTVFNRVSTFMAALGEVADLFGLAITTYENMISVQFHCNNLVLEQI